MAQVMELTINGNIFKFKAGFAFIREIEPIKKQKQNGVEQDVGLNYILGGLYVSTDRVICSTRTSTGTRIFSGSNAGGKSIRKSPKSRPR